MPAVKISVPLDSSSIKFSLKTVCKYRYNIENALDLRIYIFCISTFSIFRKPV